MAVKTPAAYGIYADDIALRDVVQTLNQSGFDKEDICMMVSPQHPIALGVREGNIPDAGRECGAARTMGWLMKFGAVMIPTVGLFKCSEPFLHAFGQEGFAGCLQQLQDSSRIRFLGKRCTPIRVPTPQRGVLLYVACPETAGMTRAVEVLGATGARETATLQRAAAQVAAA